MPQRALLRLTLAAVCFAVSYVGVQARVFTAKDGRTIEGEVLGFEGDTVRVKRADTGQVFALPLDALAVDDRQALLAEAKAAAAKPKPLPPGSLQIDLSRSMFGSEKKDDTGLSYTYEQWGFNIVVTNRSNQLLQKLRAEYVLFLDPSEQRVGATKDLKLKRRRGQAGLDDLPMSARTQFRTDTVEAVKVSLKPGWVWGEADKKRTMRDKLLGVWVRVYRGDELISEISTPPTLSAREKWEGEDTATKENRGG
jgi:hypothetical protein